MNKKNVLFIRICAFSTNAVQRYILEINWNRKTQEKINFIFQTNVGFTTCDNFTLQINVLNIYMCDNSPFVEINSMRKVENIQR